MMTGTPMAAAAGGGGAWAMDHKQILFGFDGRINRKRFWLYAIVSDVAVIAIAVIFGVIAGLVNVPEIAFVGLLAYLPLIWVGLALSIKRLHDVDRPGLHLLFGLIPLVGPILLLVWCGFTAGNTGENQYGADPLQA